MRLLTSRTPQAWRPRASLVPAGTGRASVRVCLLGLVALGLVVLHLVALAAPRALVPVGLVLMAGLAFANGANDVSKGIATLVGAGVTSYDRAIFWGTCCTGLGAFASALAARALVATFSAGLLVGGARFGPVAASAILLGAIGWVVLATYTGLPVSTTHAITGAIVGVGLLRGGPHGIVWGALGQKIVLPLAASPLLAVGLALMVYALLRVVPRRTPLSTLHWLSSGATSFARGLNDGPKIVALGLGFVSVTGGATIPLYLFFIVAAAMMLGSWVGGRHVTSTLAEGITHLEDREGLAANLATSLLVSTASHLGLPVSTTHVASGAIIGVGARRGLSAVRWQTVGQLGLAWLVTLPAAGLLAAAAFFAGG